MEKDDVSPEEEMEKLKIAEGAEDSDAWKGLMSLIRQEGQLRYQEMAKHAFWSTQPVCKYGENVDVNEPIEEDIPHEKLRKEPYSLPEAFEWSDVDLTDDTELDEVYALLRDHYVEDDDNKFRFEYSTAFLRWALLIPGWRKQWHVGVRAKTSRRLFAFISAVPQTIRVYDKEKRMAEINYLCIHKKLRSKRLTPVLIKEITRRVNLEGIFQGAYTAGKVLPRPIASCRYYHRALNPRKLVECNFAILGGPNMTMSRKIKLHQLPEATSTEGFRSLRRKDVPGAAKLLKQYLGQFKIAPVFSKKEFEHIFFPRDGVVYTFVVETSGVVTDMISFYELPSTVVDNPLHSSIRAAYGYYCVAVSVPLKQLLNDALIMA